MTGASQNGQLTAHTESLFDRFPWLYAFCRDHLFRDDTGRIVASLWTAGVPPADSRLLELGCGPGFYARRLGETFGHLDVTGVDRSELQMGRARTPVGKRVVELRPPDKSRKGENGEQEPKGENGEK